MIAILYLRPAVIELLLPQQYLPSHEATFYIKFDCRTFENNTGLMSVLQHQYYKIYSVLEAAAPHHMTESGTG